MKKGIKWLLIIAVIIGLLWWMSSNNKAAAQTTTPPAGGGSTTVAIDRNKKLQNGTRGKEVEILQAHLNSKGADLAVDGIFGPKTKAALEMYYDKAVVTLSDLNL